MLEFILNDQYIKTDLPHSTTVLDYVRYQKHLKGTKIGCREGDCGACTVLIGELNPEAGLQYKTMTSCLMPLANAHGKHIVSIEGLNRKNLSPVQQAFVEESASQCGFCTPGFIVSMTGYVLNSHASKSDAFDALDGNICRCTGYKPIERAARRISRFLKSAPEKNRLSWLVEQGFLPAYFLDTEKRLKEIAKPEAVQGALEQKTILTGGGTDLYVQKPEELHAATLYTLLDKQDLKFIREENGTCHIGAATTVSELLESPLMRSIFPELPRFFKLISSTQIRNMATLGGNIINASPIGDLTIFFLALDSEIVLRNKEQRRTVKLRHFFKGYKSLDLTQGEVLEQLRFVIPQGDFHFNFEKVSKRMHLDIASVNSACLISLENDTIMEAHISMGGVSPVPLYLEKTSAAMNGSHLNVDLLRNVTKVLQEEISPISDVRGSARYKRLLARQLLLVHFAELNPNWVFHDVIMEHPVPS